MQGRGPVAGGDSEARLAKFRKGLFKSRDIFPLGRYPTRIQTIHDPVDLLVIDQGSHDRDHY
jgi:hypothetical protein